MPDHPQPDGADSPDNARTIDGRGMGDVVALRRLAAEQDGVLRRDQVIALGFTDEYIEAQIAAGRWQRWVRGVLITTTGTPTQRQRDRAALLTPGLSRAVVLSHGSAARRWGMQIRDDRAHVTVPYMSSAVDRPGLRVHRSRGFRHIAIDDGDLPTVSRTDTCIDLAVAAADPRAGMRTILHAALSMRVPPGRLLAVMDVRRPRRYVRALRDAIAMLEEGVESVLEATYAVDVEDAHGLPRARRQDAFLVDGRRRYEDCLYAMPDGDVVVRLDGMRYHSDRRVLLLDRRRDNAAEHAGRGRLRFGPDEVHADPCAVAAEVAEALYRRGWEGPLRQPTCECLPVPQHGQALTRR